MGYLRITRNGGKGHCCFETVAQAYAIGEGWDVDLVERAFTAGDSKQLFRLHTALRRLTIKVFDASRNDMIVGGMTGERTAHDEASIRRLALNYNQHITNADDFRDVVSYMDPKLGGGGHGGMRALLALCEGLGVDLPMGREVDILEQYVNGSTRKCMALHNGDGHWSLAVLNEGKGDEKVTKVGSESDVLDFIEQRVNLSPAGLASRSGDDFTSTGDDFKPPGVDVGSDTELSDSTTAPPSPRSSHPWDDDEYWSDDQNYIDHDSFLTEEEEEEICLGESLWREWTRGPEEVCLFPSVWSEWTRTHPRRHRIGGRRTTTTKKNKKHRVPRRIRDRRRRRALRRKRLARRARLGGRRRRLPTCFRGGGDSGDEGDQGPGEETGQSPAVSGAQADPAPSTDLRRSKRSTKNRPPRRDPVAIKAGYRYGDDPNVNTTNWKTWQTSQGEVHCAPGDVPRCYANQHKTGSGRGGKRKADGVDGRGGKRKADGVDGGGGKRKADGVDGGGRKRTASGGGGDSDIEWGAGGNDGDDGGGGPGSGGGSDTDGEDDSSRSSGGSGSDSEDSDSGDSDSEDSDGEDTDGEDTEGEDSDSGDRGRGGGGRGRGSGGRGRGRGGRGRGRGGRAPRRLNGTSRLSKQHLAEVFTTPSSDPRYEASDKAHIAAYQEQADRKLKKRRGTAPSAGCTKYGIGSMPKLEMVLRGLTEDSGGLHLKNGVFFDRDQLPVLKEDFNIAYTLDPNHIGVALGVTRVRKKGGRSLVVKSFDLGEYTMEDDKTKMKQWELLECKLKPECKLPECKLPECKCDGSVTLDDALRRFILHLVATSVVMKTHGAPVVRRSKYPEMMWNINDAIARLEMEGAGVELEDEEMDLQELKELKECLDGRRTLMLKVFTSCSVEDTLPANFWPEKVNGDLHEFAQTDGSLATLNSVRGLRWDTTNDDMATGILFSGDVVRGGFSEAPSDGETFGNWKAKLKNMIVLLTFAYRLGRTTNFLEAYTPLTQKEVTVVKNHHSQCAANVQKGAGDLSVAETWEIDATPEQLTGKKAWALRFVMARSALVYPTFVPVMVLHHGIRNSKKLRPLAADSVDTAAFVPARAGSGLLKRVLTADPCKEPVEAIFKEVVKVYDQTRKLRETRVAITGGCMGDSSNIRKSRVGMVDATPEERERMIEIYTRLAYTNGARKVMIAVGEVDEHFVEWGMERLAAAKNGSTNFNRDEIENDDHLFGTNSVEVANGRRKVAGFVEKLEQRITCQDVTVLSVATMLVMDVSAATVRTKDFFALLHKTMWYDDKAGILKLGMPIKAKQSDSADHKVEMACKEHDIHGHELVRWCTVMAFAGREMLKKKNNGKVSRFFGPLQTNGKQLSRDVFGYVFKKCGRSFFGEANMSIASMRSVQDTLAVEYGREMGLPKEHDAFKFLAKQQRTSVKKIFTSYLAAIRDSAFAVEYKGFVSFAGGIWKMILDRKARKDKEKAMAASATASDVSVSSAGAVSDRAPHPPSGRASYGGPAYPINADEAEAQSLFNIAKLKADTIAMHLKAARDEEELAAIKAGAVVRGSGAAGGNTATGSVTGPAAIGEASQAMKSGGAFPGAGGDKKAAGKRTIDAVHGNGRGPGGAKMEYRAGKPNDKICAGMKTLVEAIGQAYERAKAEDGNKKVLAHMNHKKDGRPKRAKIGLVNWLVANDDKFDPGPWYTGSNFPKATNVDAFYRLFEKVERYTDVRWLSWLSSETSTDAAPVA